jgi:hypothetical protein
MRLRLGEAAAEGERQGPPRAGAGCRAWWAAQDVYVHRHGTKGFHHPAIGDLELAYEGLDLSGDEALTIVTYSAEPGTPSGDGLELLAAWAATQQDVAAGTGNGSLV